MTKEQIEHEYRKLLKEQIEEEEKIIKQAKEDGRLTPGLDGNRELFAGSSERFFQKVQELQKSLDE